MEPINDDQMLIDMRNVMSNDPLFLDNPEIPADPYILNLMGLGLRRRYYDTCCIEDIVRASLLLEIAMRKHYGWFDRVDEEC